MKYKPRKYQKGLVKALVKGVKQGINPLGVSATGTGKTFVSAMFLRKMVKKGNRILFLAVTGEHVEEPYKEFLKFYPEGDAGLCSASLKQYDTDATDVLFASVKTVVNRLKEIGDFDLIFIDEADEVPLKEKSQYAKVLNYVGAQCVGITATDYDIRTVIYKSGDDFDEDKWFDELVYEYRLPDAIKDGWLSRLVTRTRNGLSTERMKIIAGEFSAKSQDEQALDEKLAEKIMREIHIDIKMYDRRMILIFACSRAHADLLMKYSTKYKTLLVTGLRKDKPARDLVIKKYSQQRNDEPVISINIQVIARGMNTKSVDYIALARSYYSRRLLEQCLGRGARLFPDKDYCLVADFGDNFTRFGPVDTWTSSVGAVKRDISYRPCQKCEHLNSVFAFKCDNCGKQFKPEPSKACRDCNEPNKVSAKKCTTCGYVFADLKQNPYTGEIVLSDSEIIMRSQRAIATKNTMTIAIKTNNSRYIKKIKFIKGKPTSDSVDFANAFWSLDITQMISVREVIRELRRGDYTRATNLISEDGQIIKLWRQQN